MEMETEAEKSMLRNYLIPLQRLSFPTSLSALDKFRLGALFSKPRRGGLFIGVARPNSAFCFSAARQKLIEVYSSRTPGNRDDHVSLSLAPPKNKKRKCRFSAKTYKQATPTGFWTIGCHYNRTI